MASSRIQWSMYNDQLIIYPLVQSGTTIEVTGILKPPLYTDADLQKELVKVPSDSDTEVQGLSVSQTKLLRYCVLKRLFEDTSEYEKASYFESQIVRLKHTMRATHEDEEYTESDGIMQGDGNA